MQGVNWAFTYNNPDGLVSLADFPDATYLVFQEEVGESGTYHLQGHVHFSKNKRKAAVMDMIPEAHFELVRNAAKSIKYCQKLESRIDGPYIEGDEPTPGKRNDLIEFVEESREHNGFREVEMVEEFPSILARYPRFAATVNRMYTPSRTTAPKVFVFYGPTATGKSRFANLLAHYLGSCYRVPQAKGSGLYFDGYDGQTVLLFDEMYGNRMSWSSLLEVTDRYPNILPIHGSPGQTNQSEYIIFCSNKAPAQWYKDSRIDPAPFYRRICWLQPFRPRLVKPPKKPFSFVSPQENHSPSLYVPFPNIVNGIITPSKHYF